MQWIVYLNNEYGTKLVIFNQNLYCVDKIKISAKSCIGALQFDYARFNNDKSLSRRASSNQRI